MHGGNLIASVLAAQGTPFIFTLCGGHISPILVGCKERGIRVIDTRHEATAVFAADAVARLTGRPGVAAVTAGPGLTNTLTAVKNAQIAQSPLVLIGGAAPTMLKGRGALQDIDQMALIRPHVKQAYPVRRVRDLVPMLEHAFREAQQGVPGPVFVECPVDLLYDDYMVRQWFAAAGGKPSLQNLPMHLYLGWHFNRMFGGADQYRIADQFEVPPPAPNLDQIQQVMQRLAQAERPLLLVGSQALLDAPNVHALVAAVERLNIPVYLSGMARGLMGRNHPLHMRHQRRAALKQADLVILAGVPCDFRLDYGRHIGRNACFISANRSPHDLTMNRRPTIGILSDPGLFLHTLADQIQGNRRWTGWQAQLRERDQIRNAEITQQARASSQAINPIHLCSEIDTALSDDAILIGDGGDFVATASYIVQPRGPLSWLDPGAFGTLGVGAGFALGAKLCRPQSDVWVLFGDGALGYSIAEFDTFVRHNLPIIAVVGNDGGWTQIAREQVEILHDDVGTVLAHSDYHRVVEGFGATGVKLDDPELVLDGLQQARSSAAHGTPVLVNALLGKTDFRKGSISM